MATLADLLRQGADKLVNLPTQAQRFVTNPQAFVQLLTGKNPLPRETGFAAGATGLSPEQGTVLDPNYQAYMQGYEQGEPISIAAMAAPAAVPVAKALAPKAGQMAEQYMVNQGFMPSLIAYHGTPHTIKGKFDISKVGTGEGAQAYGHGMYFAESPEVAKNYANTLAMPDYSKTALGEALNPQLSEMLVSQFNKTSGRVGRSQTGYPEVIDAVNDELNSKLKIAQKTNNQEEYTKLVDLQNQLYKFEESPSAPLGNLYKVDIPDEYIPNMLDWDKPLIQQNEILKNINPQSLGLTYTKLPNGNHAFVNSEGQTFGMFQKGGTAKSFEKNWTEDLMQGTGADFYKKFGQSMFGKDAVKASEALNNAGIKGIRYKDAMSRGADEGTSNFVVFDPSNVKILEQNSKPMTRKEIIEQELEKVAK